MPNNKKTERKAAAQGAQLSKQKPLVGSYFGNHKKALLHTLREQRKNPLTAFLTCSVIGIAILLPTLLAVLLINVHSAKLDWDSSAQLTVMLNDNVSAIQGTQLAKDLLSQPEVEETLFVDKAEALEEFKAVFQLGNTLDHLSGNPLPHSIVVSLSDMASSFEQAQQIKENLSQKPEVALVQLDLMWVQRLNAISDFLTMSTWILAFMLSIAVVLILGNTIRLAIESRKDEIAVLKLVGGTDAFVCRPFVYMGIFYGLGGGLLAVIFSSVVLALLSQPVEFLTSSYQSDFSLSGLNFESTLLILAVGVLLGWIGARVSVKRHISEIEPN